MMKPTYSSQKIFQFFAIKPDENNSDVGEEVSRTTRDTCYLKLHHFHYVVVVAMTVVDHLHLLRWCLESKIIVEGK